MYVRKCLALMSFDYCRSYVLSRSGEYNYSSKNSHRVEMNTRRLNDNPPYVVHFVYSDAVIRFLIRNNRSAECTNGAMTNNPGFANNTLPYIPTAPAAPIVQRKYKWQRQRDPKEGVADCDILNLPEIFRESRSPYIASGQLENHDQQSFGRPANSTKRTPEAMTTVVTSRPHHISRTLEKDLDEHRRVNNSGDSMTGRSPRMSTAKSHMRSKPNRTFSCRKKLQRISKKNTHSRIS